MQNETAALKKKVRDIDRILAADLGEPRREKRTDPLDTLVLTILSQNTNDTLRDRAWERLRKRFPGWSDVLAAELDSLEEAIRPAGLFARKARNIRFLLNWTKTTFGRFDLGKLNEMRTGDIRGLLSALPGIGPKTLAIVLLFSLGRHAFPVDTHCLRILKRLGVLENSINLEKAHAVMDRLVGRGREMVLHLNLIEFGRTRCKARKPECAGCPLFAMCLYPLKEERRRSAESRKPHMKIRP